jgi:hypothetical protein
MTSMLLIASKVDSMNNLFDILGTFKYSCNIKDDYLVEEKINSFLPTFENLSHLQQILNLVLKGNSRSMILSGAYGTGKSFLIATACAMLSGTELKLNGLYQKISSFIPNFNEYISSVTNANYLIVFAKDINTSFKNAVFMGMMESIEKNSLDISLKSEYVDVIKRIQYWQDNDIYFLERLKQQIDDFEVFVNNIENNNKPSLDFFKRIYPKIMGGEPYSSNSSSKSFDDITKDFEKQVLDLGYDGVVYIFDEFGRYLESNIDVIDVKEVQDLAEFCNRHNSKSSIFLITHRSLFQYSSKINDVLKRQEWDKVSGRFINQHIVYKDSNIPNIVDTVIAKNNEFPSYLNECKKNIVYYKELFLSLKTGEDEEDLLRIFPLNYVTAKLLPKLASVLGQNDRTFYTFLCGDETYSLRNVWINDNGFSLITPDVLFDYFEDSFRYLNIRSEEFHKYQNALRCLKETKSNIEKRVIKCLLVIDIISNSDIIDSSKEIIMTAYLLTSKRFDKIINSLKQKGIVGYRRHSKQYYLSTDTDYNIDSEVHEYIQNNLSANTDLTKILNKIIKKKYLYPNLYNSKNNANRYASCYYFFDKDFPTIDVAKLHQRSDFSIVYIINTGSFNILSHIPKDKRFITIFNKNSKLDIDNEIKEYIALEALGTSPKYFDIANALDEIEKYKFELIDILNTKIRNYFSFQNRISIQPNYNNKYNLMGWEDYLTKYLEKLYYNFKSINFEIISKTNITTSAKTARNKVITRIFENNFSEEYFSKTGPENSIARIALKKMGIYKSEANQLDIIGTQLDTFFCYMHNIITSGPINMNELYVMFSSSQLGFGYRKGTLTLLFSVYMKEHLKNLILIENSKFETSINDSIFNTIEKSPSKYSLSYIEYTEDILYYIEELRKHLILYVDDEVFNTNPPKALAEALRENLFYKSRLIFADEGYNFNQKKQVKKFVGEVNTETPSYFWFKTLPEYYKTNDFLSLTSKIIDVLSSIDAAEEEIKKVLVSKIFYRLTKSDIIEDVDASIVHKYIINDLDENNNKNISRIKKICKQSSVNWLELVTDYVSGFSYRKWNNKSQIDKFDYKLRDMLSVSNKTESTVNSKELSSLGKVLKSRLNSQIINFGKAIDNNEKRIILEELLKEI